MATTELIVQACGVIGFFTSFAMFIPMAKGIWDNRNNAHALASQSIWTQIIWITNALVWIVYGFGMGAIWSALPSFINLPLAFFSLYLVQKCRRHEKKKAILNGEACWCGWPSKSGHKIFVTAAPGYGTLVDCSERSHRTGVAVPDGTQ